LRLQESRAMASGVKARTSSMCFARRIPKSSTVRLDPLSAVLSARIATTAKGPLGRHAQSTKDPKNLGAPKRPYHSSDWQKDILPDMADLLCTLTLALAQPCLHLGGNFVVFKERLRPRKLHRFTLDEDEVNPLSGVIKQF
jgi:hypothetical protein